MKEQIINTLYGCGWLLVFMGCCASIAYAVSLVVQSVPTLYLLIGAVFAMFIAAGWLIGDAVRG